ncbi:hypothetical protein [Streptoalloteichus hindustanus]|uniref:hypothetical protein n=1 Tax=Streptoalloteichus hindustanus TaxID=2017 RepID=UPI001160F97E|nr:hypothetical protein [Streptoalloteichus hindustanus]
MGRDDGDRFTADIDQAHADDVAAARDQARTTGAGLSLFDETDKTSYFDRSTASQVPPDPHRFTVDIHGDANAARVGRTWLNPSELADVIRSDPRYKPGQPVRLLMCAAGKKDNGFASQLARELKAPVLASRSDVWVTHEGDVFASRTEHDGAGPKRPGWPPNGEWATFHPDGRIDTHDSPTPPGHQPKGLGDARAEDGPPTLVSRRSADNRPWHDPRQPFPNTTGGGGLAPPPPAAGGRGGPPVAPFGPGAWNQNQPGPTPPAPGHTQPTPLLGRPASPGHLPGPAQQSTPSRPYPGPAQQQPRGGIPQSPVPARGPQTWQGRPSPQQSSPTYPPAPAQRPGPSPTPPGQQTPSPRPGHPVQDGSQSRPPQSPMTRPERPPGGPGPTRQSPPGTSHAWPAPAGTAAYGGQPPQSTPFGGRNSGHQLLGNQPQGNPPRGAPTFSNHQQGGQQRREPNLGNPSPVGPGHGEQPRHTQPWQHQANAARTHQPGVPTRQNAPSPHLGNQLPGAPRAPQHAGTQRYPEFQQHGITPASRSSQPPVRGNNPIPPYGQSSSGDQTRHPSQQEAQPQVPVKEHTTEQSPGGQAHDGSQGERQGTRRAKTSYEIYAEWARADEAVRAYAGEHNLDPARVWDEINNRTLRIDDNWQVFKRERVAPAIADPLSPPSHMSREYLNAVIGHDRRHLGRIGDYKSMKLDSFKPGCPDSELPAHLRRQMPHGALHDTLAPVNPADIHVDSPGDGGVMWRDLSRNDDFLKPRNAIFRMDSRGASILDSGGFHTRNPDNLSISAHVGQSTNGGGYTSFSASPEHAILRDTVYDPRSDGVERLPNGYYRQMRYMHEAYFPHGIMTDATYRDRGDLFTHKEAEVLIPGGLPQHYIYRIWPREVIFDENGTPVSEVVHNPIYNPKFKYNYRPEFAQRGDQ